MSDPKLAGVSHRSQGVILGHRDILGFDAGIETIDIWLQYLGHGIDRASAQIDMTLADSTFLAARLKVAVQIFSGGVVKHVDDIVLDR